MYTSPSPQSPSVSTGHFLFLLIWIKAMQGLETQRQYLSRISISTHVTFLSLRLITTIIPSTNKEDEAQGGFPGKND